MFSAMRRRLRVSPAIVIAGLALVFAMTGGAYAAKKYLITSTKQISPSVLKALQGKAGAPGAPGAQGPAGAQGAQGPAGPAGPVGAKGDAGAAGSDGAAGAKGATGATGPKGTTGANGTSGFTETLPSKKTETGSWSVLGTVYGGSEAAVVPISFAIPLAEEIAGSNVHYIAEGIPSATGTGDTEAGSKKILEVGASGFFVIEQEISGPGIPAGTIIAAVESVAGKLQLTLTQAATATGTGVALTAGSPPFPAGCTGGTAAEPKADPGNLCIYAPTSSKVGVERFILKSGGGGPGVSRSGAFMLLGSLKGITFANGTWAVTAP